MVQLDIRQETGEHVVADQGRPDVRQPAGVSICVGLDVAGHQVVQHSISQELQLLIAASQPIVSIARMGEGLMEERLFLEGVTGDLFNLIDSQFQKKGLQLCYLISRLLTTESIPLWVLLHKLLPRLYPVIDLLYAAATAQVDPNPGHEVEAVLHSTVEQVATNH